MRIEWEQKLVVSGNGTSIWGDSNGEYKITRAEYHISDFSDTSASLSLFGENLTWSQYTDEQIEKQVKSLMVPVILENTGREIERLGWSEQGLQPEDGWNFDVILTNQKSPKNATDCRSEEGITVGLVDSIISIARVLAKRDFTPTAVVESLKDLADDEDVKSILETAKSL